MKRQRTAKQLMSLAAVGVAGALVLAGCSTPSNQPSSSSGGDLSGTLTIDWLTLVKPGIDGTIAAFKERYPNVEVVLNTQNNENYNAYVSTKLTSGTGADVMYAYPGKGQATAIGELAPNGYILDLSDRPWVGSIPETIKDKTEIDGKTYFAPAYVNFTGALYNMDKMDELGLTPPTTWDEVLEYCDAANQAGLIPYNLGSADVFSIVIPYSLSATLVYAQQPDFWQQMNDGKQTFAGSEWEQVYAQELEMKNAGCFSDSPNGQGVSDTVASIADGSALGVVTIVSTVKQYVDAAPDTTLKLVPFRATNNADETYTSGGSGAGAAVNAEAQNMELALAFVDFLGSPEGQTAYSEANSTAPPMGGDAYTPPAVIADVYNLFLEGRLSTLPDQNWPNATVQQTVVANVQQLMANPAEITPKGATEAMDKAFAGN